MISIIIIPMASIVMFGVMIKDRAHAAVIYGVMLACSWSGVAVAIHAETAAQRGHGRFAGPEGRQPRGQGSAAGAGRLRHLGPR